MSDGKKHNFSRWGEPDDLTARWLDGRLKPEELAKFEDLLRGDSRARRRLLEWASLEGRLSEADCYDPDETPRVTPLALISSYSHRKKLLGLMAISAVLLLAVSGAFNLIIAPAKTAAPAAKNVTPSESRVRSGCAILVQAVNATFVGDSAPRAGSMLPVGALKIEDGSLEIAFLSGVSMALNGPAEIELVSASEAVLRQGAARCRVTPAGRGFKLRTPVGLVRDLGTEFGLQVNADTGHTSLQVFEGEVELSDRDDATPRLLSEGQAGSWSASQFFRPGELDPNLFPSITEIRATSRQNRSVGRRLWEERLAARSLDPRLIGLYKFEAGDDGVIPNLAADATRDSFGGVVGALPADGRFGDGLALDFKRPGDRVRVLLPGEHQALTMACWVRIDGLYRGYHALYLTDGYDHIGEPHWQICREGTLLFSIKGDRNKYGNTNAKSETPEPFFNSEMAGQWFHLAVTLDLSTRRVRQYVNGGIVQDTTLTEGIDVDAVRFGPGEFGNWGLPLSPKNFPIRNFNGRIDEFAIYRAPLSGDEIQQLYRDGLENY